MSRRQPVFSGVPNVPQGADFGTYQMFEALKTNVETLTGARGDRRGAAILRGQITANTVEPLRVKQIAGASGAINVGGQAVPVFADFNALAIDVEKMLRDMETIRQTLNTLLVQLRG